MENQQRGSAEKIFQDLGKKIDEILERAKNKGEEWQLDDRMEEVKKSWSKIEEEVNEFTEENKDKFKEVGIQIEKAAQELKKAVEVAFNRNKTTE